MPIGENKSLYGYLLLFPGSDSKQIQNTVIIEKIHEIMGMGCTINSEEMTVAQLYDKYNDSNAASEKTEPGKVDTANGKVKNILVERVKEYIEKNYSNGILKNDVADYFNINKDYLGRKFKEETGKSITEYMLEIRINKAKQLIEQNYSFSEICYRVGYIDTRNFRRLFQKATGMTMQEYKDSL